MPQARVAMFSPLPPVPSGVSDYTLELVAHLAGKLDISLVPDNYAPELPPGLQKLPILSPGAFAVPNPSFLPVYHVGNSTYHEYVLNPIRINPGIVVLHETNLHSLFFHITAARGRLGAYRQILLSEHGRAGAAAAAAVAAGKPPPIHELVINGPFVRGALAVVAHSRKACEALRAQHGETWVEWIPMGVQAHDAGDARASRKRLGLPDSGVFILGSFGHLIPKKRIHVALQAFARFVGHFPDARYLLVGESHNGYPESIIADLGLAEKAQVTGYVPPARFFDYLNAVDACVNLRYPDDGETSATLIRAMAAGKPVLYSEAGTAAEVPPEAAMAIPVGEGEIDALIDAMTRLAYDTRLRQLLGRNAHRHYLEYHRPELAASRYHSLIMRVLAGRPPAGRPGIYGGNAVEDRHGFAGRSRGFRHPGGWDSRRPSH